MQSTALIQQSHAHSKIPTTAAITQVLDIEERIWSPQFGLKGHIDATVQLKLHSGFKKETVLSPFEFKTGKRVMSAHEAQTALYTLLLSDKYGEF
jgi:DNA replication ATP-dependent helicase Dna2